MRGDWDSDSSDHERPRLHVVHGHERTTRDGKRVYVKPHVRKSPAPPCPPSGGKLKVRKTSALEDTIKFFVIFGLVLVLLYLVAIATNSGK